MTADAETGEKVELRWLRPDGTEAVVFSQWYATAGEAVDALDVAILALKRA
jgi:hypothetical protein